MLLVLLLQNLCWLLCLECSGIPLSEMHWDPRGMERRLRSYTIFPAYLHNYSKEKFSNDVNIPGIFHKKNGSVKIKVNII